MLALLLVLRTRAARDETRRTSLLVAPASLLANWAAEIERFAAALTVDRGPFEIPKAGVPYLSHDGSPYRLLHDAHADLVRTLGIIAVAAGYDDAWPTHQRVRIEARLTSSTSSSTLRTSPHSEGRTPQSSKRT